MTVTIKTETKTKEFESKNDEFHNLKQLLEEQGVDYTIENGTQDNMSDSTNTRVVEPVEETTPSESNSNALEGTPRVDQDPVDWLPEHFIDHIQGTPTVNRKGYAVIASKYNVSVTAEPVTLASETDFEYAEFEAIAVTEDGQEYSGFGSAHVNRENGDSPYLLNELAETRSMKRAVSWATGIGMTAIEELQGDLNE